ncbi:hypothetical protein MN116_005224 [Schistosoma mekongi]|uniref:C2H2-type domain-containing protein n=1 Tax=Schistosoma mekongi TaxID=38744 RepID=A0AAE1ZEH3_SCHME|nr:hypothetical protein MN116_005224 [Schistosoma mekongi]
MVDVPLLTHVSETTDCSSSSCQASSTSEDSVPEGYLILTFDKKKKAVLKTAVFADVSDPRFADGYEDDDDDDNENEHTNSGWSLNESKLTVRQPGNDSLPENEVTDVKRSLAKPLVISTEATNKTYTSCYGEAFWVGEDESSEKPINSNSSWDLTSENKASQSLIRTSPLTCDTTSITPTSILQSSTESWSVGTPQSNTTRLTGTFPHRKAIFPINHLARKYIHNTFPTHFQSKWPRTFNVHLSDHSKKMLRCDQCGKYYRNDYSLHHHICLKRKDVWKKGDVPSEMIDGQVMYFCPSCRKPFKWLGNLTRHFYVHTGQRFFRCDICSKEFFSAYQVKRHMNSHTGVRFKCELCDKPFTCKYACAWHTRQHYAYSSSK